MLRAVSIVLLLLLLVLQYQLWVGDGSLGQRAELKREIEEQQIKNNQLKARNEVMTSEIEVLSNGEEGLEEIARSKLGMIGEDETFYVIPEKQPSQSQQLQSRQLQDQQKQQQTSER